MIPSTINAFWFANRKLTPARRREIIAWLDTLSDDQRKMIEELAEDMSGRQTHDKRWHWNSR